MRNAREMNPRLRIIARSNFLREAGILRRGGADDVFSGECEVALAMTVALLKELGATPEQIDRERARAREELARDAGGD